LNSIFEIIANEELLTDFFKKRKWRECEVVSVTLRSLWDAGKL